MTLAHPHAIAADVIRAANALMITAGAGMGVDSGLPDFRGNEGFWRAYPPFKRLGLSFVDLANPRWFEDDPGLAWGFYGHRLQLYRATKPHAGFAILRRWAEAARCGSFVFTSNVDGHFQRSGFDEARVFECHGSIHWMQCVRVCGIGLFPVDDIAIDLNAETCRAEPPLPACPRCGALARPNILMFGDSDWDPSSSDQQARRLDTWLAQCGRENARIAVIECGAGTAVPTVRAFGESLIRGLEARLVRINVREPHVPAGEIGIAAGALAALTAIEAELARHS
jgi:NAD-dependent SIR2 family protein deacetylase